MDTDTDTGPDDQGPGRRSKVVSVIEEFGLEGLGDELAARWRGERGDRQSLRELETLFNVRVLEAAIAGADGRTIEGEAENLYRLLTDDGVSATARTGAESKLARLGLDPDRLRDRFVSHQAIHTYLTKVREETPPRRDGSPEAVIQRRRRSIQSLRNRLAAVAGESIEGLGDAGHLRVGSVDTVVSISVHCSDCGSTYDVSELLDRGGCDCGE